MTDPIFILRSPFRFTTSLPIQPTAIVHMRGGGVWRWSFYGAYYECSLMLCIRDQVSLCEKLGQAWLTAGDNKPLNFGIIASSCCAFLCRVIHSCFRTTGLLPGSASERTSLQDRHISNSFLHVIRHCLEVFMLTHFLSHHCFS
jgi:hypothetical protein